MHRVVKQRATRGGLGRFGDPGVLVLLSLASGPKHGHAIILDVAETAGVRLGPGTLYGSIAKLVERGLIAALPADARRQPYELTAAGRAALDESLAMWANVVATGQRRLAPS
jgi:DNA-binding PadR family transcriptional regulator